MIKTLNLTKLEILEGYARKIPNAEKMLVDYGRDSLLVQFDKVHAKEYKISDIVEQFKTQAKMKGFEVNLK